MKIFSRNTKYVGPMNRRDSDPQLEVIAREIAECRDSRASFHDQVSKLENLTERLDVESKNQDKRLAELIEFKNASGTERQRDREMYQTAVSDLKQQLTELQSSVAEKLLIQDKHFTDHTADMIQDHDNKTLRLFEKIEQKIEHHSAVTASERADAHEKLETLGKQQMKFMGGFLVLAFLASIFIPLYFSQHSDTIHKQDVQQTYQSEKLANGNDIKQILEAILTNQQERPANKP